MLCILLGGGRLELGHQFSGYPSAVFHFDALGLGPLTDLSSVQNVRRSPAPAAGGLLISRCPGEGWCLAVPWRPAETGQLRLAPANIWRSLTLARCAATPGAGTGPLR